MAANGNSQPDSARGLCAKEADDYYAQLEALIPDSASRGEPEPTNEQIFPTSTRPIVFTPFYGEYGFFVMSYIRSVHYSTAPEKIVCCRPGEEIYFPSASEFFYEWEHPFEDRVKSGFRDCYSFEAPAFRTPPEINTLDVLKQKYPAAAIIELLYHIPFRDVHRYPVSLPHKPTATPTLKIVICARRRNCDIPEGDNGLRNYPYWESIVEVLRSNGLSIAQIGQEDTSFALPGLQCRSWEHPNSTEVAIDLLRKCSLYIGTDTGPTHLAALLGTPMLLFRNPYEHSYNLIKECVISVCEASQTRYSIVRDGWDKPHSIITTALQLLAEGKAALGS